MNEQNQTATLGDIRREIADARARWDREAADARVQRRLEEDAFDHALVGYVAGALGTFFACWFACGLFFLAVTGGEPGNGSRAAMTFAPFAVWLAGAAFYARRTFGPGRDGDGGRR